MCSGRLYFESIGKLEFILKLILIDRVQFVKSSKNIRFDSLSQFIFVNILSKESLLSLIRTLHLLSHLARAYEQTQILISKIGLRILILVKLILCTLKRLGIYLDIFIYKRVSDLPLSQGKMF